MFCLFNTIFLVTCNKSTRATVEISAICTFCSCYLVLGEVEDAIQCYTKFLSSGTDLCLDRRVTIEAADGLQKAKVRTCS